MKEKYTYRCVSAQVRFQENAIETFAKNTEISYSFRVQKDGYLGVYYQEGEMTDEEGYRLATENLKRKRPYKYAPETGVRERDKSEQEMSDRELLDFGRELITTLHEKYPDFTLSGSLHSSREESGMYNDAGLSYRNRDCTYGMDIIFKHKDSKDLMDGSFSYGFRKLEKEKAYRTADNYLSAFVKTAELPEELIIQMPVYGFIGKLVNQLEGENMARGTSLLAGRIGEKVFSEKLTLYNDRSDLTTWATPFFDGEGVVMEGDRQVFIDKGVVVRAYADKATAERYGIEHTATAGRVFADIPTNGNFSGYIERSEKTTKELLQGRLSVVPLYYDGGGFNEKGDYVMPVQRAYLCDGEKLIGMLPEFTMTSNLFDMFGDDFIGIGSDEPVYNDKCILIRMKYGH